MRILWICGVGVSWRIHDVDFNVSTEWLIFMSLVVHLCPIEQVDVSVKVVIPLCKYITRILYWAFINTARPRHICIQQKQIPIINS